jgi:hypothetical protein
MSCILYLILLRVRYLFLHWQLVRRAGFAGTGQEGGGDAERNGLPMLCARGATAIGRGGHMIQKGQYHWSWAVGAGVVGTRGEGWGLGMKGRGVAYFYHRPMPTSITLAFFKSMHWDKKATISRF